MPLVVRSGIQTPWAHGLLAQLVEHRSEVPGAEVRFLHFPRGEQDEVREPDRGAGRVWSWGNPDNPRVCPTSIVAMCQTSNLMSGVQFSGGAPCACSSEAEQLTLNQRAGISKFPERTRSITGSVNSD